MFTRKEGNTVRREDGPWNFTMKGPLVAFVLTYILGGIESSAPLYSPDTDSDSIEMKVNLLRNESRCADLDTSLYGTTYDLGQHQSMNRNFFEPVQRALQY